MTTNPSQSAEMKPLTHAQRELLGIWASWPTDDQGCIQLYGRAAQRSVDALVARGFLRDHGAADGRWYLYEVTDAGREVLRS